MEKYDTTSGDMKINRLIQILGISYLFWHILSKSLETYLKSKELFSNKRKMFFPITMRTYIQECPQHVQTWRCRGFLKCPFHMNKRCLAREEHIRSNIIFGLLKVTW